MTGWRLTSSIASRTKPCEEFVTKMVPDKSEAFSLAVVPFYDRLHECSGHILVCLFSVEGRMNYNLASLGGVIR
jgi:hypothetical protein